MTCKAAGRSELRAARRPDAGAGAMASLVGTGVLKRLKKGRRTDQDHQLQLQGHRPGIRDRRLAARRDAARHELLHERRLPQRRPRRLQSEQQGEAASPGRQDPGPGLAAGRYQARFRTRRRADHELSLLRQSGGQVRIRVVGHRRRFLESLKDIFWGMRWLLAPAVLVTLSLVIANAISISVRERRMEIAVLKVLGFRPGHVLMLILGEAVLIGALSGLLQRRRHLPAREQGLRRDQLSDRLLLEVLHSRQRHLVGLSIGSLTAFAGPSSPPGPPAPSSRRRLRQSRVYILVPPRVNAARALVVFGQGQIACWTQASVRASHARGMMT